MASNAQSSTKPTNSVDEDPYKIALSDVQETTTPTPLQVQGTIPTWLRGSLFRAGPARYAVPTDAGKEFQHTLWLDALSAVHKFDITSAPSGQAHVTYQCRLTANGVEATLKQKGQYPFVTVGQDPCTTTFARFFSVFRPQRKPGPSDAVVNVQPAAGFPLPGGPGLVVKTDANILQQLDEETLEPKAMLTYTDFNPAFRGFLSAAHSQVDRATGEWINFTLDFGPGGATFHLFSTTSERPSGGLITSLKAPPAYIHSFGCTQRYIILPIYPYTYALGGVAIPWYRTLLGALRWDPRGHIRFLVVDRATRRHVATFQTTSPGFCFHTVNAYDVGDDGNTVAFDMCMYDDPSIIRQLSYANLWAGDEHRKVSNATLRRYHLQGIQTASSHKGPLQAREEIISQSSLELPRINPHFCLKPYSYVYGMSTTFPNGFADRLIKIDVRDGSEKSWSIDGGFVSEPMFVAAPHPNEASPDKQDEDDGILLSSIIDTRKRESFLVVLDAKEMKELGRATAPWVISYGLHGNFTSRF